MKVIIVKRIFRQLPVSFKDSIHSIYHSFFKRKIHLSLLEPFVILSLCHGKASKNLVDSREDLRRRRAMIRKYSLIIAQHVKLLSLILGLRIKRKCFLLDFLHRYYTFRCFCRNKSSTPEYAYQPRFFEEKRKGILPFRKHEPVVRNAQSILPVMRSSLFREGKESDRKNRR